MLQDYSAESHLLHHEASQAFQESFTVYRKIKLDKKIGILIFIKKTSV